jgi:hypothetical protein
MKRIAAALSVMLLTAPAMAHDEIGVVGTVLSFEAPQLRVTTRRGNVIANLTVGSLTKVLRDKARVGEQELKPGQFVVAVGYGDGYDELEAVSIEIVPTLDGVPDPPPPPPPTH